MERRIAPHAGLVSRSTGGVKAIAGGLQQGQITAMARLTTLEIKAAQATVPTWSKRGARLQRTYEFQGFPAAVKFVNTVAQAAEKARHHPDIEIRWNRVTLTLTTHDAGGLTEKDFALAARCDAFAGKL